MIASRFDAFLFDLDGVIYVGDQALPGAVEALARLRALGKAVRFLTNDPVPTRGDVVARLRRLGIPAGEDEVVTSGWATAQWLRASGIRSAFVLGSAGLAQEIRSAGVDVTRDAPEAVVVGADPGLTLADVARAAAWIHRGARFVATNPDASFPTPHGPAPAAGALVRAVEVATGRRPIVVGKPEPFIFHAALAGLPPNARAVMVGDNPATDVLGAHRAGIAAVLVAAAPVRFPSPRDFRNPDAVIRDLSGLFEPGIPFRPWEPPPFPWPDAVRAGVAGVVRDGAGRVLLVRRADRDVWSLPMGRVEPGESAEEALRREVWEETGLTVRVGRLVAVYSDPVTQVYTHATGETVQYVTACFLAEAGGGEPRPDGHEVLAAGFFAPDDPPEPLFPPHRAWIAAALA